MFVFLPSLGSGYVLQPIRHVHLTVHRHGFGKLLLSLPAISTAAMQFAETQVAVGDEGTHPDLKGERHGLPVVGLCHRRLGGVEMSGHLAEHRN